ncbi:ABC transporter ATP-binding protein [Qaidamihabitans albus]|uniref:ABC transporter ATP-binding protein n=1 Tax=Qaidamihabitans albus TaxID=2795733 RepID=UPI0018F205B7|nr:ATP-binding cassette domain-containing protein [Qaidamihabitans albus]
MTLSAHHVSASYRPGQMVVDQIDLEVAPGGFTLVLGHNGAGKTTFMNAVFGIHRLDGGEVRVEDRTLSPGSAARLDEGVSFVPSEHAVFPGLTVEENLEVSRGAVRSQARRRDAVDVRAWFPVLEEKWRARAGSLSGGQRRMLAVAMALVQSPRYLLMDEPSLGLAPTIVDELFDALARLRRDLGLGMIVVEQTVRSTLLTAERISVIRGGRVAFAGNAEELARQDLWDLL